MHITKADEAAASVAIQDRLAGRHECSTSPGRWESRGAAWKLVYDETFFDGPLTAQFK